MKLSSRKDDQAESQYWTAQCLANMEKRSEAIVEFLKIPVLYNVGKWGITANFEAGRLFEAMGDIKNAKKQYMEIVKNDGKEGLFGQKAFEKLSRLEKETEF